MSLRRTFLQRMAAMPLMSAFVPGSSVAAARSRDYFAELGVRPFINAAGTYTTLTASLMPTEVTDAIVSASMQFVPLMELQDKVGEKIAAMLGSEAAMVTSGAAGALVCGTAACVTGDNNAAILQLPDLTNLKSEVLIQKSHRYGYDHAVRAVGIKMIEIETADELDRAVSSNTAMMLFFNDADPRGKINAAQWVALGKKHKVPTFVDASADVPPVENLTRSEDGLGPGYVLRRQRPPWTAERRHPGWKKGPDSRGAAKHIAIQRHHRTRAESEQRRNARDDGGARDLHEEGSCRRKRRNGNEEFGPLPIRSATCRAFKPTPMFPQSQTTCLTFESSGTRRKSSCRHRKR